MVLLLVTMLWWMTDVIIERPSNEALAAMVESIELPPAFAEVAGGAWLLSVRGRLRAAQGAREAAEADLRQAARVFAGLGFGPMHAPSRSALALVLGPDDRDEARALVAEELALADRAGFARPRGVALRARPGCSRTATREWSCCASRSRCSPIHRRATSTRARWSSSAPRCGVRVVERSPASPCRRGWSWRIVAARNSSSPGTRRAARRRRGAAQDRRLRIRAAHGERTPHRAACGRGTLESVDRAGALRLRQDRRDASLRRISQARTFRCRFAPPPGGVGRTSGSGRRLNSVVG